MHRSVCICALLPRLETRARVIVLLHQLEVDKPTNTGVVAARCLANSEIVYRGRAPSPDGERAGMGPGIEEQAALLRAAIPAGARAAFLFPHEQAVPLDQWRDRAEGPLALVVPDGTWRQAMHARSRLGRVLDWPCVTLPDARVATAGARLRNAGRDGRLATIEALAFALGVLEGPDVEAALLHVFRVMTDRTLWTNGRIARADVTGGVPAGARAHDPLGEAEPRDRRTRAAP
jgi:DTW domain-containing protein YfiP